VIRRAVANDPKFGVVDASGGPKLIGLRFTPVPPP